MRFKPPPTMDSNIGWRVEFRSLDNQLTDFENAAFITLLFCLVSWINHHDDVNTAMPITLIDENMERAHARNAIATQKFWWPDSLYNNDVEAEGERTFSEKSLAEIMEQIEDIIQGHLNSQNLEGEQREYTDHMVNFIVKRARGEVKTGAQYIRDRVAKHPEYMKDSHIHQSIAYDVVAEAARIGGHDCEDWPKDLLGVRPQFMNKILLG